MKDSERKELLLWEELNASSPKRCYKAVNKLLKIKIEKHKGRKDT